MKIWLDDLRPAPSEFVWCRSVNEAKKVIAENEKTQPIELIDCDHDLGDFFADGGDGIKLLDWLLERNTLYPVALHTMNPVGRENMRRMLQGKRKCPHFPTGFFFGDGQVRNFPFSFRRNTGNG